MLTKTHDPLSNQITSYLMETNLDGFGTADYPLARCMFDMLKDKCDANGVCTEANLEWAYMNAKPTEDTYEDDLIRIQVG